jgi:hypothetical protein
MLAPIIPEPRTQSLSSSKHAPGLYQGIGFSHAVKGAHIIGLQPLHALGFSSALNLGNSRLVKCKFDTRFWGDKKQKNARYAGAEAQ